MEQDKFVEIVKEHGWDFAQSVLMREQNKDWKCPHCKSLLIITGQGKYETGIEHVTDPNKEDYPERDMYQCSDEECVTRLNDVFWDYYGDRYGSIEVEGKKYMNDEKLFVAENDSPFGSNARKSNVEIYCRGLKRKTMFHPAWCLWMLQPFIEWKYTADTDGNVLSKKPQLKFLKKDKNLGYYMTYFTPCWSTWSFLFARFKNSMKLFRETNDYDHLDNAFNKSFNRNWPYRWFEFFMKVLYFRSYIIYTA